MKPANITTLCRPTDPPPWWAGVFAMDARWWLLVAADVFLCGWLMRRDLPRLQAAGRVRVGWLWALSIVVGFGGILCFEAISAYFGPLGTWYDVSLRRLTLQGCSTAGLDASFRQLAAANITLVRSVASGVWVAFPLVMIALRRVRRQYIPPSEAGTSSPGVAR